MSTNNTQTQDQTVICNLLSQRNRFLSLLKPPPRYDPISPYPNYTKQQLDMRRKAEILQYKKNSTQTNRPTKAQKWSMISNNSANSTRVCEKVPGSSSPSSACDVPGPLVYLTYDPSIPLYNYTTNQDVYSNFTKSDSAKSYFILDISAGILSPNNQETQIGSLMIQYANDQKISCQLTIPLSIYVSGTTNGVPAGILEKIRITDMSLNIYYYTGETEIEPYKTITITNAFTNTHIFDLSMSFIPTAIIGDFYGSQYIGDIIIPSITLPAFYGYIYDFKLVARMSLSSIITDDSIETISYGLIMNTPNAQTYSIGCDVTPQNPSLFGYYTPFSFYSNGST